MNAQPVAAADAASFDSRNFPDVRDDFSTDVAPGKVIRKDGTERVGVDRFGAFSVDNGALRIGPIIDPGWGQTSLAYGPFERKPGLACAVYMLNGHNTAQSENISDTLPRRFQWWWEGSFTDSRWTRLRQWWASGRQRRTFLMFRWWVAMRKGRTSLKRIDENLAVGFYPDRAPTDPVRQGNGFVMHATGIENGELWAGVSGGSLPLMRGVQNVPLYYVVVLREKGAAYYAAATPPTMHLPGHPWLRPVAIDASCTAPSLHAVVSQSTNGQIGFRLDTRVYGVRVAGVAGMSQWYGSAHVADRLAGSDAPLTDAEMGGSWTAFSGELHRTAEGAAARAENGGAIVRAPERSGLLHALVRLGSGTAQARIVWNFADARNYSYLAISETACKLVVVENGAEREQACAESFRLDVNEFASVQLLLGDREVRAGVNGQTVVKAPPTGGPEQRSGVGFELRGAGDKTRIRDFEAHPERIPLPAALDMGAEKGPEPGTSVVATEEFEGPPRSLEAKPLTSGGHVWHRLLGTGHIDVTGEGSGKVRASPDHPMKDRTAFSIPWQNPDRADLEVEITAPGTGPNQKQDARVGFILWQDPRNYITLNVYRADWYPAASISVFYKLDDFEDIYDASWANIGRKVWFGEPVRVRMIADGSQYLALVDDEPVLFRKMRDVYPHYPRLHIRQVGLVLNWEWGYDTGSVVRRFIARA
jgi:hypothetical protein